ncbi:MAG TPA: retropepsin-like aspartic protease [Steroidobacteraceae bacterium]|nr:retropepsin-like aspartic protease [Steroidobacteraceae bacterium]
MLTIMRADFWRSWRRWARGAAVAAAIATLSLSAQRAPCAVPSALPPPAPTAASDAASDPTPATATLPSAVTSTLTTTVTGPTAAAAAAEASSNAPVDELMEIIVQGRGPRFVSPTRRDQIGRIWAPVLINGLGPFRLVLDTGASHSGITRIVALVLGIPTDSGKPVILTGVTGSTKVPAIHVDTLSVGDLSVDSTLLPILPDAFGGAEGVLGYEGLSDKRVLIDFRRDLLTITYSRGERAAQGFLTIPFRSVGGQLVVIDAIVGHVRTKAIIDTGGQTTIANMALHRALERRRTQPPGRPDEVIGVSLAAEKGEIIQTPDVELGAIKIRDSGITYSDVSIFKQWKLLGEPSILIGMDVLGLLDTLIIDYRRHELQLRMDSHG